MEKRIDLPAVEGRKLSKQFGDLTVLDQIDFSIAEGETVALIGPSGSGKSTLLRLIGGLETISGGILRVEAIEADGAGSHRTLKQRTAAFRGQCGMVFQSFNLFPHMTALENVIEAPRWVKKMSKEEARNLGEELLARVDLADKRDEYPSRLSGGQQQRVAIARTLAMDPKILLFDEPTSALDPELVGEVQSVIRDLTHRGLTSLIVSHEMRFAAELADRVLFLDKGYIVEEGVPEEFFKAPKSSRAQKFLNMIA